jgi:hypothetical protein
VIKTISADKDLIFHMTSLIYNTTAEVVHIATDTLCTYVDGQKRNTTSKAVYLPHLRTIIVGTGIVGFALDWTQKINDLMDLDGIENLDFHAPQELQKQWKLKKAAPDFPDHLTATIYQFGISKRTNKVLAYRFQSTEDFASEKIGYRLGIKPPTGVVHNIEKAEDFYKIMQMQIHEQNSIEFEKRIHIGGECIVLELSRKGCQIFSLGLL